MKAYDELRNEVIDSLGDFANDFDIDGIVDEVSVFDDREGFAWKDGYTVTNDEYDELAWADMLERHVL